ncbi:MAG: GTPase ObgE [Candidatus Bipolaricaulota bacterium]|nr:GTPase ObgE [Candidatus Bipolaricaulota bacterium]MDW8152278.1 GTPase ObgE [Candidatus Bipolaricaulota bacterium]
MGFDEAVIHVSGGKGGDGLISFARTRHNPRGSPDGGRGGDGGSVILRASRSVNTFAHFHPQVHFRAEDGAPGGPNNAQGKRGEDLVILVPVGTVVRDLATGALLADLVAEGQEVVVARGGRGGRGNKAFASSARRAPRIREFGEPGEARWLKLELRLLADVGIIGFPNVGKSSLLSRVSDKKPKVAAYPFTTLTPNLGVVRVDEFASFVMADLPGLIEGAHEGRGLGDKFLRHATRAKLLLHLVDLARVEGRDPLSDYFAIRRELAAWEELRAKPEVVAGNKIDLLTPEQVAREVERFAREGIVLHPISAHTGQGVRELIRVLWQKLQEIPPEGPAERPRYREWQLTPEPPPFAVAVEGGRVVVRGPAVEALVRRLDLSTPDAREYLWEELERLGVVRALRRQGVAAGTPVVIGGKTLEFVG